MAASADNILWNRLRGFDNQNAKQLNDILRAILSDIDILRQQINTHVHSGVTAGGANTAVATTQLTTNNANPVPAATLVLQVSA